MQVAKVGILVVLLELAVRGTS